MKPKDRTHLRVVASMLGIPDGHDDGEDDVSPGEKLDRHDWSRYLLAKDYYPDYDGPDWVPYSLWSDYHARGANAKSVAKKFIYDAGARSLWAAIETTYAKPSSIPGQLVMECVRIADEWRLLSKIGPKKHKEHMLRLKSHALALAQEVERMEALEFLTTGERYDFMRLYSEADREIVHQNVYIYNIRHRARPHQEEVEFGKLTLGDYMAPDDTSKPLSAMNSSQASREAGEFWELLHGDEEEWPGIVPALAPMMRRMGEMFSERAKHPPLQRPSFGNAERNFFARNLCLFFRNSFGHASPSIIAQIVGMFFPQAITDNDISQMIRKLPAMDQDPMPEYSPEK